MSTVDSVATTVLNLADCAEVPAERIGGKALGLGRLLALDVDVPPGFVVTTELFVQWMRSHGLDQAVRLRLAQAADAASLRAAASDIAELISSHSLESAEIDALYGEMPGGSESAVAVRSSATGEDSEETSYAGQQETFLWVRGAEAVRRRIVDCWASLFSVEAVEYRRNMGLAPEGSEMAVVVQQMVPAEVAGVMFTIDPLTGDPSQITIESTFGLGLPLVSGEVTPDRYCVDKVTLELRSQAIAHKPFAEQLDLPHLLEGFAERRLGVFELGFEVVGRALEVVAPLYRRLGVGRIGEMTGIVNPGAILLDLDVALEIAADALELADHALDLGDPAASLLDLKLLQANECFA